VEKKNKNYQMGPHLALGQKNLLLEKNNLNMIEAQKPLKSKVV
jgi:hypothetical protein